MKLYEFSYTDNLNQTEAEVLVRVVEFLNAEGEKQGWAAGYNVHQSRTAEQVLGGDRRYHFEVLGHYEVGVGEDHGRAAGTSEADALPRGAAAFANGDAGVER